MADVCSANVGVRDAARFFASCFVVRVTMARLYHALPLALLTAAACSSSHEDGGSGADAPGAPPTAVVMPETPPVIPADPWSVGPPLGARRFANGDLEVRVKAPNATRVELCIFVVATGASEVQRLPMTLAGDRFELRVPNVPPHAVYGFRAFGPNWPYDPAWTPGTETGLVADVDAFGNRMNPNKLLVDPYALEITHDPVGIGARAVDTGPTAPKSVVVVPSVERPRNVPARAIADDVVYEVHVRGFTMNDPTVPEAERGTYRGAARRAAYLKDLGIRAVEFLPIQETSNDQNDRSAESQGDNYWGYSTVAFFAPDRRYSFDRSPGGPTREFQAMVDAFHAEGIKVWMDVVYNHVADGGVHGFRGLDNRTYLEVADNPASWVNGNGVGPNFNTGDPVVGDLVVDSLRYWHDGLGVDGFRFDLASIVANSCSHGCYQFAPKGLPARIAKELPARGSSGGADLIAEPWGLVAGSYQVGGFPEGWSSWNDHYRDAIRQSLNRLDVVPTTPRDLAKRIRGSADLYGAPSSSLNLLVAHDGMTLHDVFAYDQKSNDQAWPWGPSNGGTDNDLSWSHAGDPARQRAAARAALALSALSAGVPMITGGDERLRTQQGNNNAYNLDSPAMWLDWSASASPFTAFVTRAFAFRHASPSLRPAAFWKEGSDVVWLRDDGQPADAAWLEAAAHHFLGWRLGNILVGYNRDSASATMTLPAGAWSLVADTSESAESWGNWGDPVPVTDRTYAVGRRSVVVFVAR